MLRPCWTGSYPCWTRRSSGRSASRNSEITSRDGWGGDPAYSRATECGAPSPILRLGESLPWGVCEAVREAIWAKFGAFGVESETGRPVVGGGQRRRWSATPSLCHRLGRWRHQPMSSICGERPAGLGPTSAGAIPACDACLALRARPHGRGISISSGDAGHLRLHFVARLVAVPPRSVFQPRIMASVRQSKNQSIQAVMSMEPDCVTCRAR